MELLKKERSILLVVDLQGKLMDMVYAPTLITASTIHLLKFADLFQVPVILTEQYPQGLGPTHPKISEVFQGLSTKKYLINKTSFGCWGDTQFVNTLQQLHTGVFHNEVQIIVAGIEAHICVMQTVLELITANYQVYACWDCISSRGEENRQYALARMQQAGAAIISHESVAFEWARDKNHPQFKKVNQLLKDDPIPQLTSTTRSQVW